MVYRIVTRSSPLALQQTELAMSAISEVWPDFHYQIMPITTALDTSDLPVSHFGGKISFVKELEEALLSGLADIAVHSLKDMAVVLPDGLCLAAVLERKEPRDVLVSHDFSQLSSLPQGAVVGTSSKRRSSQILAKRPDIRVAPCRGNINTRLDKMARGDFDALLLAGAALERLGSSHLVGEYFAPETMLPACGQGVIAIQCAQTDLVLRKHLAQVSHDKTAQAIQLERQVVANLGGHCQLPLAVYAEVCAEGFWVRVALGYADGSGLLRESCKVSGVTHREDALVLEKMCQSLLARGGAEIINRYS